MSVARNQRPATEERTAPSTPQTTNPHLRNVWVARCPLGRGSPFKARDHRGPAGRGSATPARWWKCVGNGNTDLSRHRLVTIGHGCRNTSSLRGHCIAQGTYCWTVGTLLTCWNPAYLLWNCLPAGTLLTCWNTAYLLEHCLLAGTLLACSETASLLEHCLPAGTLLTCRDIS